MRDGQAQQDSKKSFLGEELMMSDTPEAASEELLGDSASLGLEAPPQPEPRYKCVKCGERARCIAWWSLVVVLVLGMAIGILACLLYPTAPEYNVCNKQETWAGVFDMLTKMKVRRIRYLTFE